MLSELISTAIRPISRLIRKIAAQKLRFLAIVTAFAFLLLNSNADTIHDAATETEIWTRSSASSPPVANSERHAIARG